MASENFILQDELTVKSRTDNLSVVRDFIQSYASKCGLEKSEISKIVLAVDEACTNIIKHAYKFSPEGDIHLKINCLPKKFIVSITDKGNHFNPELIPEPDLQAYQKEKKKGGLGIFLIKKLMDEVTYKNLSNNLNQVELVKYIN
ncbi:MAG: hypothetical protein Fur0015_00370 [Ignavibacteriales bacterium]